MRHTTALLSLALLASAGSAQHTLPLRIDFSAPDDTETESAVFPVYESMLPSHQYDFAGAEPWGWDELVANLPVGFAHAFSAIPNEALFSQEMIDTYGAGVWDSEVATRELMTLRDGHFFPQSGSTGPYQRLFRARVTGQSGSVDKVRVQLSLGKIHNPFATPGLRAMRVYNEAAASAAALVTREKDPIDPEQIEGPGGQGIVGVWARTLFGKTNLTTDNYGGTRSIWFDADVDSEVLSLLFELEEYDNAAGLGGVMVDALQVFEREEAPIVFDKVGLTLAANPSFSLGGADLALLNAGIADLNAGDPDLAEQDFTLIDDSTFEGKLARVAGLLWTAGWLGEEGIHMEPNQNWRLVNEAIAELQTMDRDRARVAEYLELAQAWRRAYMHTRLRGYPNGAHLPFSESDEGPLIPNLMAIHDPSDSMPNNLNRAEALWHDVAAQDLASILGTTAAGDENPHVEINPLFFSAQVHLGMNWAHRSLANKYNHEIHPDPLVVGPNDYPGVPKFNHQAHQLWRELDDFGLAASLFPKSSDLRLAIHISTYDDPNDGDSDPDYDADNWGGIVFKWNGEDRDEIHGTQNVWWDALLTEAHQYDSSGASTWSLEQYRAAQSMIAAHEWWNGERLNGDSYGGGAGDDIEFVGLHNNATFPVLRNELELEANTRRVIDEILSEYDHTGSAKYYFEGGGGIADVEHTAEDTGYSLVMGQHTFWGDPYYLDYAMRMLEYLDKVPANPSHGPWTEQLPGSFDPDVGFGTSPHSYPDETGTPQPIPLRRFLAWHLDARGSWETTLDGSMGTEYSTSGDVPMNGKALFPIYYLNDYVEIYEAREYMREWAEWWWTIAMDDGSLTNGDPGQQKPVGVLPAVVDWDGAEVVYGDALLGGGTANWWISQYGFFRALKHGHYIYNGLFLERYLDEATPASERWHYLQPIYEAGKLAAELWREGEGIGTPLLDLGASTADGSLRWTAQEMLTYGEYKLNLGIALPFLKLHGDELDDFASFTQHTEYMSYLDGLLADQGEVFFKSQAAGTKDDLIELYQADFDWRDGLFPVGTNLVHYTDRVFLFANNSLASTLASITGGFVDALPDYALSWIRPHVWGSIPTAPPLQVSTLFREATDTDGNARPDKLVTLIRNHENVSREAWMCIWQLLETGRYELRVADNSSGNDTVPGGTPVSLTFDLHRSGQRISVNVPAETELVVELLRTGPVQTAAPDGPDVAVGPTDLRASWDGAKWSVSGRFHNVGLTEATNESVALWVFLNGTDVGFYGTTATLPPASLTPQPFDYVLESTPGNPPPAGDYVFDIYAITQPAADDPNQDNNVAYRQVVVTVE